MFFGWTLAHFAITGEISGRRSSVMTFADQPISTALQLALAICAFLGSSVLAIAWAREAVLTKLGRSSGSNARLDGALIRKLALSNPPVRQDIAGGSLDPEDRPGDQ